MKNRLFDNYTMFCLSGIEIRMQTAITQLSTDHEIRSYMFGEHNNNARQEIHKVIAYHRDDPRISRATSPEFLQTIRQKGIYLPDKLEEFVILHAGLPFDTMRAEQLKQYTSNENTSLRQPAA